MKRRAFGFLASTSLAALKFGYANAQISKNPALLTSSLTPLGAERAGNADGSIPAWTGGYTTLPAGYQTGDFVPNPFADEQPVVVINADNMAQHADRLTEGVMEIMKKYGFSIKVFPTHRTVAAPQSVYDHTATNISRAQGLSGGTRLGFRGAYGGIPFPIPDTTAALEAGAQVISNHTCRWGGRFYVNRYFSHTMVGGQFSMASSITISSDYAFYDTAVNPDIESGIFVKQFYDITGPATELGQNVLQWVYFNPSIQELQTWELLNGQGRVRRAPEISFDTPDSQSGDISNYDEGYMFSGPMEKYDWKYLGKKEMYIPYHNNDLYSLTAEQALLDHFLDPNVVRWELHRVHVVEATLHPGERNVLARRMLYSDEDTWTVSLIDAFDANNNLYHVSIGYNNLRPELPGLIFGGLTVLNLQTDDYSNSCSLNEKAHPSIQFPATLPESTFDPQNMAAAGQY
jgi:hypothetical protein